MTAYLIVRATVPEADRAAFETWYQDEHLPDAHRTFGSLAAFRGWSDDDPGLHIAFYRFPDIATARATVNGDGIKGLIAEFDRTWGGRIPRTREVVEVLQSL